MTGNAKAGLVGWRDEHVGSCILVAIGGRWFESIALCGRLHILGSSDLQWTGGQSKTVKTGSAEQMVAGLNLLVVVETSH